MKRSTLVGQTFLLSPRDIEKGGNTTQSRTILREYTEGQTRFYEVLDPNTGNTFPAIASVYDQLFQLSRQPFKNKFTKGDACFSQQSVNFRMKN